MKVRMSRYTQPREKMSEDCGVLWGRSRRERSEGFENGSLKDGNGCGGVMKAVGVIGGDGSADVGERSREGGLATGSEAVRLLKFLKETGGEDALVVRLMSLRAGDRGLAPLNEDAVDRGGVSG